MDDTEKISKIREDVREVKTDVKHVLLQLERVNGRIGSAEGQIETLSEDVIKTKTVAGFFSGIVSLCVSYFISNR